MKLRLDRTKSTFLIGLTVAFISLKIFLGGVTGYYVAKFLANRVTSIVFTIGKYKIHLHHWLVGITTIALVILYDLTPFMNHMFFGFLGGAVLQGIVSYPDWSKIVYKKIN
jgi:hypothetical protein